MKKILFPLAASLAATVSAEVIVTGNPHYLESKNQSPTEIASDTRGHSASLNGQCVAGENLVPENIMLSTVWPLQTDTIKDVIPVKMRNPHGFPGTFRAPVYHFVQSPRIVEKQLPFKLLLLKEIINSPSVISVPVDLATASDSWFPGFKWDLLLGVNNETKEVKHLGWKFSQIGVKSTKITSSDDFYALIVEHKDEEEAIAEYSAKIGIEDMIKIPMHPKLSDLEIAPREADKWMIAALATAMKLGRGSVLGA